MQCYRCRVYVLCHVWPPLIGMLERWRRGGLIFILKLFIRNVVELDFLCISFLNQQIFTTTRKNNCHVVGLRVLLINHCYWKIWKFSRYCICMKYFEECKVQYLLINHQCWSFLQCLFCSLIVFRKTLIILSECTASSSPNILCTFWETLQFSVLRVLLTDQFCCIHILIAFITSTVAEKLFFYRILVKYISFALPFINSF